MSTTSEQLNGFEIAIVGMACRFPDADNADQFWANILAGRESVRPLDAAELAEAGLKERLRDPDYINSGSFLDNIDRFDAGLFSYSAREADLMDPQHRLFLQVVWEALENAGCAPDQCRRSIGVFAGAPASAYLIETIANHPQALQNASLQELMYENNHDLLATRVSYKLNLDGPSVVIGSACSTSLVLVHYACQALIAGECDIAIAGAARVSVPQKSGYTYAQGGILSRDGHCRAFDRDASGTIAGSGVGAVVLKRLNDALADRDSIQAVIKGTAINNDGARKVGFTAPSLEGQVDVVKKALLAADVAPETIGYMEAHGTATALGDPVEIRALTKAYGAFTRKKQYCAIGSVKSNIGHLDTAAGMAGLIKAVQALRHKKLPPGINYRAPNPEIDFGKTPFYVATEAADWQSRRPRRAAVSAFGIGGTNAHVILEEGPPAPVSGLSRRWQLFCHSGKTRPALRANMNGFAQWLARNREASLADAAYTLKTGRVALENRCAYLLENRCAGLLENRCAGLLENRCAGENAQQVIDLIAGRNTADISYGYTRNRDTPVVFMFPGQGAQYENMGADLYAGEPVFRDRVDECAALLEPCLHTDIRRVIFAGAGQGGSESGALQRNLYAQPALFVIEYALVRLLESWGIQPKACIGQGVGEYVAACLGGVFDLPHALLLVAARARTMAATYTAAGLPEFERALEQVPLKAGQYPYLSTLTGDWITPEEVASRQYWLDHLHAPAQFAKGISALSGQACVFLEVGPGSELAALAERQLNGSGEQKCFTTLRTAAAPVPDDKHLLMTLGCLWCAGVNVDWKGFYAGETRCRLALPTYAFQCKKHWLGRQVAAPAAEKQPMERWFYQPAWHRRDLPQPVTTPGAGHDWLLFMDTGGALQETLAGLAGGGRRLWVVRKGKVFRHRQPRLIEMDPDNQQHYEDLVDLLHNTAGWPDRIAHAAYLGAAGRGVKNACFTGYHSLILLAKTLARKGVTKSLQLFIVSSQLQDTSGFEPVAAEKSLLVGPCKVIPKEYGTITCRSIDIDTGKNARSIGPETARALVAELATDSGDPFVALRRGRRFVQRFEPVDLGAVEPPPAPFREQGVYLITGGFGGIGSTIAEHLCRRYRASVILTTRNALPPQSEWEQWLAGHDAENKTSRKINQVEKLRAAGGRVFVLAADAADKRMAREIAKVEKLAGRVNGIVHAAGIADGALIQGRDRLDSESVFAAKVEGTRNLSRVFRRRPLDFFVLCSSLSAYVGPVGQVAYCSANAYLDAFARAHPLWKKTVSIGWDSWKDVGMAVDSLRAQAGGGEAALEAIGHGIEPAQGLRVLERILACNYNHVLVSTRDLSVFDTPAVAEEEAPAETEPAAEPAACAYHERPELHSAYIAPRTQTEREIAAIWQEKLGIAPIGVQDDFFELHGHSLLAVQIITEIKRRLQVVLPAGALYEYSTVEKVAAQVGAMAAAGGARANAGNPAAAAQAMIEV